MVTGYRKGSCEVHKDCDNKRMSCAPVIKRSNTLPDGIMSTPAVAHPPSLRRVRTRPSDSVAETHSHTFPRMLPPDPENAYQKQDTKRISAKRISSGRPSLRLPLRKQSLQDLSSRANADSQSPIVPKSPSQKRAAGNLEGPRTTPADSRPSLSDGTSRKATRRKESLPEIDTTDHASRSITSRLAPVEEIPPSPSLRNSASIPDYRALKLAHPDSGSTSPGSKISPNSFSPTPSSPPRPQNDFQKHHFTSPRQSNRSTITTNASSTWDLGSTTGRSSIATNRTSTSEQEIPPTPWSVPAQEEEIGIDELLSLYADGFGDAPSNNDHFLPVTKQMPPSPLNPHRDAIKEPPVPKIPDIHRQTGSETPTEKTSPSLEHGNKEPPAPKTAGSSSPLVPPKNLASESGPRSSAQIMAGQLDPARNSFTVANSGQRNARDRYGFKKESQFVAQSRFDEWNEEYELHVSRRREKWHSLMKSHDLPIAYPKTFPPRSDKIKRFIRKGIPPEWRGAAWFWYAGGPTRLAENRGLYEQLLQMVERGDLREADREHIERDLHRTLPDNDKFKVDSSDPLNKPSAIPIANPTASVASTLSDSTSLQNSEAETPHIHSLRRVLRAFAIHHTQIGYCQSLNFLAAHLLLFLNNDEEKAFHLLCILTEQHLPGTHGFALEGANVDITVLMMALKACMPTLWDKLDDRIDAVATGNNTIGSQKAGVSSQATSTNSASAKRKDKPKDSDQSGKEGLPTVSLATTSWFMSCFVGTLPPETCARVWDVLFYEGSKTLFRVALGVFRFVDGEVRNIANGGNGKSKGYIDPMEVFQVVQTLPRALIDANALMETSFGRGLEGRGLLSREVVEGWRQERRGIVQREREDGAEDEGEGPRSLSRGPSVKRSQSMKRIPTRLKSIKAKKSPVL